MIGLIAAISVAMFGFLFAWSDLIQEFGGKRLSAIVSIVALLSMWLAFELDPEAAMDIVMKPARELVEKFTDSFQDQFDNIGPSTTTTTPGKASPRPGFGLGDFQPERVTRITYVG